MANGEGPFLPGYPGIGLDTEWKCPEKDCSYVELGKADFALGNGVCKKHPNRLLIRLGPHG